MTKKLPAFTIMEVTLAMLLSAIVIGLTYTCYSIIHQGYLGFKTRQQDLVTISQLNLVLNKDAEKAELLSMDPDGLSFGNVKYALLPDMVIRTAATADTFQISTKDIELSFEGKPVTGNGRLDEVRFVMFSGPEAYIYHFRKRYSAQQLFYNTTDGQN